MTTNQTIDGVPRELLENFASYAEGSASGEVQLWVRKLRALLDKTDAGISASTQKVVPLKLLIDLSKPLVEDVDLHARISARNELRDLLGDDGVWVASAPSVPFEQHLKVISGSEQPAPVAVVLPERREPTQDNPYLSDADREWNACVDELKRLNPSL